MKKFIITVLTLCSAAMCFMLSACNVSDSPENVMPSEFSGIESHDTMASSQTDSKKPPERQDPEKTPSESAAASDSDETDAKETSSGTHQEFDTEQSYPESQPNSSPTESSSAVQPPTQPIISEQPNPTSLPEPTPEENTPPTSSETSKTEPDMESEYRRIINEVIAYAQSYTAKGFIFVWDDSLEFGWETGYMGTPRVKYEGVDGVIGILKRHIDMIVKTATDPGNGIPGYSANYKVMQVTVDGDIAFVVLYG